MWIAREAEIREEGRAEGEAKGRAEGRAEGEAKGREEGRKEGRKEGEIAVLQMLVQQKLLSAQDAAKAAGMSVSAFMEKAGLLQP